MTGKKRYGKKRDAQVQSSMCGRILLLLAVLSFPLMARAQVDIRASLSRDTILIGDQLAFTLQVVQPEGLEVQLPLFADSIPSGLEVLDKPRTDTLRRKDGRLVITRTWKVTSFDTSGVVLVDPVEVSWEKDSMQARLETRPLQLVVQLLPVDEQEGPKDIKKPYKIPVTWQEVVMWSGLALVLAALIWLAITYWLKRKAGKGLPEIKRKPAEPAHVFALRELNALKEARLWQQGRVKEYYTRLTDILRNYLEYRYGIRALERTTPETLEALKDTGFNDNRLSGMLENILQTGDLVKFAKFIPQPDVNESLLLDAYVFVNETKESWKKETEGEQLQESGEDGETAPEESLTTTPEKEGGKSAEKEDKEEDKEEEKEGTEDV